MAENFFGLTDTGKVRSNNEDTFIARELTNSPVILAAVIDGVGGYTGGEVAAEIAHDVFIEQLSNTNDNPVPAMIAAFKLASRNIFNRKADDKELESMACVATMALVDLENNQFYYAHVGDTRLYLLRDGSLIKISKDHSFVGFLEDSGRLTETAAMNHPKRNEINKALGFTSQIDTDESFIETGQSPFLPGDMLLLCSDGLTDLVDKNSILQIITQNTSLQEKAKQLINAANANGGRDNVTVVLVYNNKLSQKPAATMPATAIDQKKIEKPDKESTSQPQPSSHTNAPSPSKKGSGLTLLLGFLCLVFLASTVWLYMSARKAVKPTGQTLPDATQKMRTPAEVKLQDAIDAMKGDTLVLSDTAFKQPIMITDTLHADQDTLYIKATGNIILQRDTAYTGPALSIAAQSKVIILDNITFKDFKVAVDVQNTDLYLKGIRFVNCGLAVQRKYSLSVDKPVAGVYPGVGTDTSIKHKNTAKPNGAR